ncbi:MAG: prenyltransferase [Bacteroides sp.]|nr:prenyltransferase [Bacteroides sp.]
MERYLQEYKSMAQMEKKRNAIGFWIDNARAIALPQSVLPAILAVSMSAALPGFSWWLSLAAVFGVACAHLGMNLADDYFDYKVSSGEKRNELASEGLRARIAKYPYLTSGQATVGQLRNAIIVFLAVAIACGAVIACFRGWPVLAILAIGGFLGISYSGFPFRFCYYGYGELVIGLMFGPLLMIGVKYASCGVFGADIVLVSIAVGMLVTNILYMHSIMDAVPDSKMDKMTFARLLKRPVPILAAAWMFIAVPFILVAAGVLAGVLHPAYCCVFLLLPMAVYLGRSITDFVYQRPVEICLRPWMGPMGNFRAYEEAGIGWFMLRWLLARNLLSFFCLIIAIVNIVLAILD